MSQEQYKKAIEKEIRKLNERIDFKILRGERYSSESRQHKALLQKIKGYQKKSLFGRLFLSSI